MVDLGEDEEKFQQFMTPLTSMSARLFCSVFSLSTRNILFIF